MAKRNKKTVRQENPCHSGWCSLCKIRKARAAGSWCAAFQRIGATAALQRRRLREPETSLHQANSLNATDPHSGGTMHTWKLRPERLDSLKQQRSPLPRMVFHGWMVCFVLFHCFYFFYSYNYL